MLKKNKSDCESDKYKSLMSDCSDGDGRLWQWWWRWCRSGGGGVHNQV